MDAFKDAPQPFNPYIYAWNDFFIYTLTGPYLPAGVGGLPLQYVLRERRRLQLILVKGHLVYNHGLRVQTGEPNVWVGWAWRLDGTERNGEYWWESWLQNETQ